jgi:gliding motility-associated-like protein
VVVDPVTGRFDPATAPTLYVPLVYTLGGCSDTVFVAVNFLDALFTTVPALPSTRVTINQPISFTNATQVLQGAGPATYTWDFGDNNTSTNPDPTHTYLQPGTYTITLTVTDNLGCTSTRILANVIVITDQDIVIPNVVTPNGDGINDLWLPRLNNADVTKIVIYDRQGRLIYSTTTTTTGWNCKNLQDINVPDGTYYYVVEGRTLDTQQKIERRGSVTVLR